jgi:hypothetical protein
VRIRRGKGDQEGQEIVIPRGYRLRPVEAVEAWLAPAGITSNPVFRSVAKGGRVQAAALKAESVADIVKHYATCAGLDPSAFAGHSLRSGFLTSAAEHGASVFKMMEVSRHLRWTRCAATCARPICSAGTQARRSCDCSRLVVVI